MKQILHLDKAFLEQNKIVDYAYLQQLEPKSYDKFLNWIDKGNHGSLSYLSDHRKDLRKSLKTIFPECQSVIVFLFDYRSAKKEQLKQGPKYKVASYVSGFEDQDYHFWISERLNLIGEKLKNSHNSIEFKISLDIHPVLERDYAVQAGLGWIGKNSMLINRKFGSYTLIGSLLLNQKLETGEFNNMEVDHCGNCRKCIDACPTQAILENERTLIADKCISTYTIETFKDKETPMGFPVISNEVFGCDICQEVCPWNTKPLLQVSSQSSEWINFFNKDIGELLEKIKSMSNKEYKNFFKRTSFERLGKKGLIKNLTKYSKD